MKRLALLCILFTSIGVPVASGLVNEQQKAEPDNPLVYAVPKGTVYHKSPKCVTLRKSKTVNEIFLTDAGAFGLIPCLQCNPPVAPEKAVQLTIEKLLAEPEQYDGKRVRFKGTVAQRSQIGGPGKGGKTALTIADGDKKIAVISNFGVAVEVNASVMITGMFKKETSKVDATPIAGSIEIQADKTPEVKKGLEQKKVL